MRLRPALALMAAVALAGFIAGCGSKYELPTERRGIRVVPSDGSYQMLATWHGMDGIQDALLTQGNGTQLFLLFNHGGAGASRRGDVKDYFLSAVGALLVPPSAPLRIQGRVVDVGEAPARSKRAAATRPRGPKRPSRR